MEDSESSFRYGSMNRCYTGKSSQNIDDVSLDISRHYALVINNDCVTKKLIAPTEPPGQIHD